MVNIITKNELITNIKNSNRVVAFTGAGISIPSGVPSFNKVYLGYSLSEILHLKFFKQNPHEFYKAYTKIFNWTKLPPNKAHLTLNRLNIPVITQNIDTLHQKAGSTNCIELHGNLNFLMCPKCKSVTHSSTIFGNYINDAELLTQIYCKNCNVILEPSLVLFGQSVYNFPIAVNEVIKADLLLVIGNSLKVWPSNQIVNKAIENKCKVLYINQSCEELLNF